MKDLKKTSSSFQFNPLLQKIRFNTLSNGRGASEKKDEKYKVAIINKWKGLVKIPN